MQLIPLILGSEASTGVSACLRSPDEYGLLQKSVLRGTRLPGVQKLIAVTNRDFFYRTKAELNFLSQTISLISGPFQQNTAAVLAAAAAHIAQLHGEDTLILVLPINHLNVDEVKISVATKAALSGYLVTFGMHSYNTNAKYVYPEGSINALGARQFLWNSNLFLFKAGVILQAIKTHCPGVLSATLNCLKHSELKEENNCLILDLNPIHFLSIPHCSINDEVIQKSSNTVMLSCGLEWLDNSIM
ncbi:MAG: hypothetical protein Q8M03_13555 [Legionella sp.]|nr:hypothetical protein [Legionella sp.]